MVVMISKSAAVPLQARCARGFTLLELMIVVAIVAILSAIAYASYQNQIIKSRRPAATTCPASACLLAITPSRGARKRV